MINLLTIVFFIVAIGFVFSFVLKVKKRIYYKGEEVKRLISLYNQNSQEVEKWIEIYEDMKVNAQLREIKWKQIIEESKALLNYLQNEVNQVHNVSSNGKDSALKLFILDDYWVELEREYLHNVDYELIRRIIQLYPQLNLYEARICNYFFKEQSIELIASQTRRSQQAIKASMVRILLKLKLSSSAELVSNLQIYFKEIN